MDDVVAEYSPAHGIHIVLDNYCTHKRNEEWLAKNTNAHFHFTPTSASWLNQVEIWFGIFCEIYSFATPSLSCGTTRPWSNKCCSDGKTTEL